MIKETEDIIEIKPSFYGVGINLRAFWRYYFKKDKKDPAIIVAERFLQIFRDHGVADSQIPRLVPEISLDKFRDAETLLPALTDKVIENVSKLFKIQRAWLEGTTNRIYSYHWSYKAPHKFFEALPPLDLENVTFPIVAFCSNPKLDYRSSRKQPIVICFAEKVAHWGEKEIDRYIVFHDNWDWNYWKSRIQIKAMIRIVDQILQVPRVPLYLVESDDLKKIESGYVVPGKFLNKRLENISLDDFSLTPEESVQSKESEELPQVEKYIKDYKLNNIMLK